MKKSWPYLGAVIAHLAPRRTSLRRTEPPCVARMNVLPYLTRPYMVAVLPLLTGVPPGTAAIERIHKVRLDLRKSELHTNTHDCAPSAVC